MTYTRLLVTLCFGSIVGCSVDSPLRSAHREAAIALLSCTEDTTVLQSLKSVPRSCTVDDHCPFGAYCDLVSHQCSWDCLRDVATSACAGNLVCDCSGKCVSPSGGAAQAASPPKLT